MPNLPDFGSALLAKSVMYVFQHQPIMQHSIAYMQLTVTEQRPQDGAKTVQCAVPLHVALPFQLVTVSLHSDTCIAGASAPDIAEALVRPESGLKQSMGAERTYLDTCKPTWHHVQQTGRKGASRSKRSSELRPYAGMGVC